MPTPSQRTNYATDWSDIQPRLGFAYQFIPKTVLRGGYGIYYGQSRSGVTGVVPYGCQGFNQFTNVITTFQNDGATPYLHLNNPFPNGLIQPAGNSLGLMNDVGFGANGPLRTARRNQTPYEQSWSLGIRAPTAQQYRDQRRIHRQERNPPAFQRLPTSVIILGPWVESLPTGLPMPNNHPAKPSL